MFFLSFKRATIRIRHHLHLTVTFFGFVALFHSISILICFFLCRRNISCVGWKLVPTNWEIFFSISFHSLFSTFNIWFSKVDQHLSLLYPDTQVEAGWIWWLHVIRLGNKWTVDRLVLNEIMIMPTLCEKGMCLHRSLSLLKRMHDHFSQEIFY